MMRDPFALPDDTIVDMETGLALNVPASLQEYPGWWKQEPEKYVRLQKLRQERGIVVNDFPKGTDRIVEGPKWEPMSVD